MPEVDPDFFTEFEKSLPHHEMILVEGGSFLMGNEHEDAEERELPVHEVKVSSFFLGKYPVTYVLWERVMQTHSPIFKVKGLPVEKITWYALNKFIQSLNSLTRKSYRLPTESEWEFAARGGIYSEGYKYSGSDRLKEVGWYEENIKGETQVVGGKISNELGIHGMSGNIWEWVEDHWHSNYIGAPSDGSAWIGQNVDSGHVIRGGSWISDARFCRVSYRLSDLTGLRDDHVGFRLALSLPN